MGCDLSKQTLQIFKERTQEVDESIKAIKQDHESLAQSLKNLTLPMEPEETVQDLKDALVPHLEKIENMLEEIKKDKEEKTAKKMNKNEDQKKSVFGNQEVLNKESQNAKGTKEVMSILEDPAIKAMIEKNRQKFVGKKK